MVGTALEALVGCEVDDQAVFAALSTVPGPELAGTLRGFAREHREAALPVLARGLDGRPEWAVAAAEALAILAAPAAAEALARAEARVRDKSVRTAIRRALYRLRQAGIAPTRSAAATPAPVPRYRAGQAWLSPIDGSGSRGLWLVLEGPLGERVLLSTVLNDELGVLDFAAGPIAKKRLEARLHALRAETPLPWVAAPPARALSLLAEARQRHEARGAPLPRDLARWLDPLPAPPAAGHEAPDGRIVAAGEIDDPALLEPATGLLELPECGGWFLDPPSVQADAVELLEARESRLVVSDQIRAEREAALVDRIVDREFTPAVRHRWERRLEETAFVLLETGRLEEARRALATARALGEPGREARHVPFVRALVERSLAIAGEVALGRVPAAEVSRAPGRSRSAAPGREGTRGPA
jgi:hypothetical protein